MAERRAVRAFLAMVLVAPALVAGCLTEADAPGARSPCGVTGTCPEWVTDLALANATSERQLVATGADGAHVILVTMQYPRYGHAAATVTALEPASGSVAWTRALADPERQVKPSGAAVNPVTGDAYVLAWHSHAPRGGTWLLVAFDGETGEELWRVEHQGEGTYTSPRMLLASPDGARLHATGTLQTADGDVAGAVLTLDAATGHALWNATIPGNGSRYAGAATLSPDSATLVASAGTALAAFDAAEGGRAWVRTLNGTPNAQDAVYDVAFSADGDAAFVTTAAGGRPDRHLVVTRLDASTGAFEWVRDVPAVRENGVGGFTVSVAPAGASVVVTGSAAEPGDQVVVALDPSDGAIQWTRSFGARLMGSVWPLDAFALADGVVAAGVSQQSGVPGLPDDVYLTLVALTEEGAVTARWDDDPMTTERHPAAGSGGITRHGDRLIVAGTGGNGEERRAYVAAYPLDRLLAP